MRRVIPYIASQFKKDKIWLRRTRPSKRQYQIIMAVDNSYSMVDSKAKIVSLYYEMFLQIFIIVFYFFKTTKSQLVFNTTLFTYSYYFY